MDSNFTSNKIIKTPQTLEGSNEIKTGMNDPSLALNTPPDFEGAATSTLSLITKLPYAANRILRIKNMGGGELQLGLSENTTFLKTPMILSSGEECTLECRRLGAYGDKLLIKVGPDSLFTGIGYKLWVI